MRSRRNAVFDIARVIAMFFVMLIHSTAGEGNISTPEILFLKDFLARGAVPVFFILSGYLGARRIRMKEFDFAAYSKGKFNTLIVPFVFWNLLVLVLVLGVKSMTQAAEFRGNGAYFDVEFSATSIACALFGIGRSPIVYQFWFLRDLIVVSFVAVAVCRLLPRIPFLPWFFFFIPVPMAPSLGYYLLGHELYRLVPPDGLPSPRASILFCCLWSGIGVGLQLGFVGIPSPIQQMGSAAFMLMIAVVLTASALKTRLAMLGAATFFVYATHEPLQTILARIWQSYEMPFYGSLFSFLFIPTVVFCICVAAYFLLSWACPHLIAIATGGREWLSDENIGYRQK